MTWFLLKSAAVSGKKVYEREVSLVSGAVSYDEKDCPEFCLGIEKEESYLEKPCSLEVSAGSLPKGEL